MSVANNIRACVDDVAQFTRRLRETDRAAPMQRQRLKESADAIRRRIAAVDAEAKRVLAESKAFRENMAARDARQAAIEEAGRAMPGTERFFGRGEVGSRFFEDEKHYPGPEARLFGDPHADRFFGPSDGATAPGPAPVNEYASMARFQETVDVPESEFAHFFG